MMKQALAAACIDSFSDQFAERPRSSIYKKMRLSFFILLLFTAGLGHGSWGSINLGNGKIEFGMHWSGRSIEKCPSLPPVTLVCPTTNYVSTARNLNIMMQDSDDDVIQVQGILIIAVGPLSRFHQSSCIVHHVTVSPMLKASTDNNIHIVVIIFNSSENLV